MIITIKTAGNGWITEFHPPYNALANAYGCPLVETHVFETYKALWEYLDTKLKPKPSMKDISE